MKIIVRVVLVILLLVVGHFISTLHRFAKQLRQDAV
jgi:hypothetical protein